MGKIHEMKTCAECDPILHHRYGIRSSWLLSINGASKRTAKSRKKKYSKNERRKTKEEVRSWKYAYVNFRAAEYTCLSTEVHDHDDMLSVYYMHARSQRPASRSHTTIIHASLTQPIAPKAGRSRLCSSLFYVVPVVRREQKANETHDCLSCVVRCVLFAATWRSHTLVHVQKTKRHNRITSHAWQFHILFFFSLHGEHRKDALFTHARMAGTLCIIL